MTLANGDCYAGLGKAHCSNQTIGYIICGWKIAGLLYDQAQAMEGWLNLFKNTVSDYTKIERLDTQGERPVRAHFEAL